MRRRSPIELTVNHDRWLVSYSDFVTLLFAFFVVMYSISQVNEGKYRVLSSTLLEAFSVPQSAISPIQVGSPSLSTSPSAIEVSEPQSATGPEQQSQTEPVEEQQEIADFTELAESFNQQFSDLVRDNLLRVNSNEMWLEIELKDSILFPTASADPSLQAKAIFEEVAQMLTAFNNPVQVEGFTDNVPINNRRFSSNWELSAARSASVVKILANNGIEAKRLSAVGYGEFQPIANNDTAEGRAQNRRVVLMIARERAQRPSLKNADAIGAAIANPEVSAVAVPSEIPPAGSEPIEENVETNGDATPGTEAGADTSENDSPVINPIRLRDGGLLFTNDPNVVGAQAEEEAEVEEVEVEETPVDEESPQ